MRCPEHGLEASIKGDTPFTHAEFVAMLDALSKNAFLWEENLWHERERVIREFLTYARRQDDSVQRMIANANAHPRST